MNDEGKQMYLPGLQPNEKEQRQMARQARLEGMQEKTFTCQKCSTKEPSVTWCDDTHSFLCWACGQVDTRHTKEVRQLLKEA